MAQQSTATCTLPSAVLAAHVFCLFVDAANEDDRTALRTLAAARLVCRVWRAGADEALRALLRLAPRDATTLVALPLAARFPALHTFCFARLCRNVQLLRYNDVLATSFAHVTRLDFSDCAWLTVRASSPGIHHCGADAVAPCALSRRRARCCAGLRRKMAAFRDCRRSRRSACRAAAAPASIQPRARLAWRCCPWLASCGRWR